MSKGTRAPKVEAGLNSINGATGPFLIVNPQWSSDTSLIPALVGKDSVNRVYIVGFDSENHEHYVVRLRAAVGPVDGCADVDPEFGNNGFVPIEVGGGLRVDRAIQIIDITLEHVTISYEVLNDIGLYQVALLRFLVDGRMDTTFGLEGVALFPQLPEPSVAPGQGAVSERSEGVAAPGANGEILLVAFKKAFAQKFSYLIRINQNGWLDTSYAEGTGYLRLSFAGSAGDSEYKLSVDSRGRAIVLCATEDGQRTLVARFVASGALDPGFGGTGIVEIRSPTGATTQPALNVDGNDKVIISVKYIPADPAPQGVYLFRLDDNGNADLAFNNGRPVEWIPDFPTLLYTTDHVAIDEQQRIILRSVYEDRNAGTRGVLISRFTAQGIDSSFGESGSFALPGHGSFYGGLIIQTGSEGAIATTNRQDLWKIMP